MNYQNIIVSIIEQDRARCLALKAVRSLALPDWLIAAGFVRNAIWDHVYGTKTSLNDIDVIYFCESDISIERDIELQNRLLELQPTFPWSVKNQARMHVKNGDPAYLNTKDAMQYWPEKQTSIGVKYDDQSRVAIQHCFDLELQFNGRVDRNPVRAKEIFEKRLRQKSWKDSWPELTIEH